MSDAIELPPDTPKQGLDGKHEDIKVPSVSAPDVKFSDTSGHDSGNAILALAERGIINGYTTGAFVPEGTITRAEFAAVIVRALGLKVDYSSATTFGDVPVGSWFSSYVNAAYRYGIIQGRSAATFEPHGLITRQEAAVMVFRTAALCGLAETLDDNAIRNILAQFTDYKTVAPWATEAMALCYYANILDDDSIEIDPLQWLKRGEAADMAYRMLRRTQLI